VQAVPREVAAAVVLLLLAEEAAGLVEPLEPALHPVESVPVPPAGLWELALHLAESVPVGPWEPALRRAGSAPARPAVRAQREPVDERRWVECCGSH